MKICPILFVFCLFLSTDLFANSSRPACSLQLLCNQLKTEKNILISSLRESPNRVLEKLQKIFSENQVSILELLASKKNIMPMAAFTKLVTAISTVSLGSFDEPAIKKVFPGACNRPNAIYIYGMHRIFVCPSLMNYPEVTLQQILAHELGHVIQKMQDYVPCFNDYPKTQREEVFADWVASKVLAVKLASEKNPTTAGKQAFDSQLLFLGLACSDTQKTKPDWARSHPNLKSRVENIFLSQPAFQEALRCHARNTKSCG